MHVFVCCVCSPTCLLVCHVVVYIITVRILKRTIIKLNSSRRPRSCPLTFLLQPPLCEGRRQHMRYIIWIAEPNSKTCGTSECRIFCPRWTQPGDIWYELQIRLILHIARWNTGGGQRLRISLLLHPRCFSKKVFPKMEVGKSLRNCNFFSRSYVARGIYKAPSYWTHHPNIVGTVGLVQRCLA